MDSQQQTFVDMMDALNKRMEQFEQVLHKSPAPCSSSDASSLSEDFAAFKAFTTEVLRGFQLQMGLLAQNVDDIDMQSRRKILLFHGVPEEKQENVSSLVVGVVTNQLKLSKFNAECISRCQRMGRVSSDKPRPILVKFRGLELRTKIWSSKTSLKGTNFALSEFLTKTRHQAFMKARERFGVKNCWTRDGYIYVLAPDGKRHRACCDGDIIKIASIIELAPQPAAAPDVDLSPQPAAALSVDPSPRAAAAPGTAGPPSGPPTVGGKRVRKPVVSVVKK